STRTPPACEEAAGQKSHLLAAACIRLIVSVPAQTQNNEVNAMVLTKEELIASLQNEVRILLHLAGKIDRTKLDYRPTPKQRSTLELLQYLVNMGPLLVRAIRNGSFDVPAWEAATKEAKAMNFDQVLAAIGRLSGLYA